MQDCWKRTVRYSPVYNRLRVHTLMAKEITGFTNSIKNEINRRSFGFVFSSENAMLGTENVHNSRFFTFPLNVIFNVQYPFASSISYSTSSPAPNTALTHPFFSSQRLCGADQIALDEKSIKNVVFGSESAVDSNARATDFGVSMKIWGKMLYKLERLQRLPLLQQMPFLFSFLFSGISAFNLYFIVLVFFLF